MDKIEAEWVLQEFEIGGFVQPSGKAAPETVSSQHPAEKDKCEELKLGDRNRVKESRSTNRNFKVLILLS